jgi:small subunit ribosomal protein S8|tara:strand:- start:264 stop:662 length:399 start_codon:yes stop_codon:yes gene_type:complete
MNLTDPIADMLTRIRNAIAVRHGTVTMPSSKPHVSIADILKKEGFIEDFEVIHKKTQNDIVLRLRYRGKNESIISGLKRVSKPGLRKYVSSKDIKPILGGIGISVISTSQGVMTGQEARRKGIGGEYLCYLW